MRNLPWILPLVFFLAALPSATGRIMDQTPAELSVIDVMDTGLARETLYQSFDVLEDLGDYLVARPTRTEGGMGLPSTLIRLPGGDKNLYVVSMKGVDALKAGTLLFEGRDIALVAADPAEARALERPVCHFGLEKGIRPLHLQKIAAPRSFKFQASKRTADARVQAMVDEVSAANLQSVVQDLQNMGERYADSGAFTAETYLVNRFNAMGGLTVSTHHFSGSYSDNVIAELPGVVDPSVIYIVGGHYDSTTSNGAPTAPGADDNASGTSGVCEIARVLSQYPFKYTLRFVCFSAEELGLVGSGAYCDYLVSQGDNVQAMINLDMTAYRAAADPYRVGFVTNYSSSNLINFVSDMMQTYVPSLGITQGTLSAGTSDHQSFTTRGFTACFPFEDLEHYSPYIHSTSDVIGTSANDFTLSRMITQGALAALATLAAPLDMEIVHSQLTDTTDSSGPYTVEAQISSLIGSAVDQAVLHYDLGSGYAAKTMVPSGDPDGFISSIPGLPGSGIVKYYIESTDVLGNTERLPDGLGPDHFEFYVGYFNDIFADDFEVSDNGWTHGGSGQDDWMRNVCTGNGGYDAGQAWSGTRVWGNDLGITGYNGNYQPGVNNWLQSPAINCTGQTGVKLRFRRWLTVQASQYDQAKILVNGNQVYVNPAAADLIDTEGVYQEIDISAYADNNPSVVIRFTLTTNSTVEYGGWNIDDLHVGTSTGGDVSSLSRSEVYFQASVGGAVDFDLDAGMANGGRTYLILGSFSGTSPGLPLPGGATVLPVNWDAFTDFMIPRLNSPIFSNFLSTLDPLGQGMAQLSAGPISASKVGKTMYYAYCLDGQPDWDFASNAVDILIVP